MDLDDLFKHRDGHRHQHHRRDDGFGGDREARRHGHLDRRDDWQARGHGPFGSRRAILALVTRHRWLLAAGLVTALVLLGLATWLLVALIEAVAPAATAGLLGQLRAILALILEAVATR